MARPLMAPLQSVREATRDTTSRGPRQAAESPRDAIWTQQPIGEDVWMIHGINMFVAKMIKADVKVNEE